MKKESPFHRLSRVGSCWAIALVASLSMSSVSFAASSVQFEIAEGSRLLEASLMLQKGEISHAEFHQVQHAETCKNPSQRLQDRNRPWMMVWNTSDTPDDITTVKIDLTEPGFEFGDGDIAGDGFGGLLSILSPRSDAGVALNSATYGDNNTELVLNFTGLSADMAAIFRFDIDEPGGALMFPDYREAMLGADTGDGPGQLALMTTEFSSEATAVSQFAPAGPLSTSGITEAYRRQTMSSTTTSTTVPEPSTMVLLLAGFTGIAAMRRTR
jgi:hypothetical protein